MHLFCSRVYYNVEQLSNKQPFYWVLKTEDFLIIKRADPTIWLVTPYKVWYLINSRVLIREHFHLTLQLFVFLRQNQLNGHTLTG